MDIQRAVGIRRSGVARCRIPQVAAYLPGRPPSFSISILGMSRIVNTVSDLLNRRALDTPMGATTVGVTEAKVL